MLIRSLKLAAVTSVLCLGTAARSGTAYGDDLKRRGMVGIRLGPVNDEAKQRLNLSSTKGVLLNGIIPDSAAQKAGLLADDVIVRVGPDEIDDVPTFIKTMRKYGGGDTLKFYVIRAGNEVSSDLVLLPRPMETATEYDVVYDSAGEPGQRVRTVLTKPKDAGKHAAVLFIQGLAPNTIEFGTPQPNPYRNIIAELTKAGFVTMRVERRGVGDSDGLDVQDTTIEQDIASFRSGWKKLSTYDYVDSGRVFLFSHSSGGAIAPMVAQGTPVKGIATYAAFARPWMEHSLESSRTLWKLELLKDDEINAKAAKEKLFYEECFGKKRSPKEILAEHPELKEHTAPFLQNDIMIHGVHYRYMQQLAGLDVAAAWAKVDTAVLTLWGESDYIASKTDSELVAAIVNRGHPGKATFVAVPGIDHGFNQAEDQEESYLAEGAVSFNPVVIETLTKWIKVQGGS